MNALTNPPDLDLDAVEKAFGAYLTTIIRGSAREGKVISFDDLRDGKIIAEALYHEQPDHFSPPSTSTSTSASSSLTRLKRIYHQLLTCPSCTLATYLPIPNLELISNSSSQDQEQDQTWKSELTHLLRILLLVQTVWSTRNAGVIAVITELEVDEQKVLKEMIEVGLSVIPSSTDEAAGDEVDVQAEQVYLAQLERRRKEEEFDRLRIELERAKKSSNAGDSSSRPRPIGSKSSTPSRRRPSSPDLHAESSDEANNPSRQLSTPDTLDHSSSPSSTLPITPLRKRPVNGLAATTNNLGAGPGPTPASPMERMKNLEIDRLRGELDEKDGEISRLEKMVGDGNKVVAGHVQRISSLEEDVQEIHSLRDELEVRKHASENLRKSEAMVDKMKRRLEEGQEIKERVQILEAQNKELIETNALLEVNYKQLSVSKSRQNGGSSRESDDHEDDGGFRGNGFETPGDRPRAKEEEERLRRDLREKQDEIERLCSRVEELESEVGGHVSGDDVHHGLPGESSRESLEPTIRRGSTGGSLLDGLTRDQTARMLEIKQDNVLLQEQVKALDQKLVDAKRLLKEQEEMRESSAAGTTTGSDDKRARDLEKTIDKLQQQQREADERFHLERIIALKAWKDLGRRATRPQRDARGN